MRVERLDRYNQNTLAIYRRCKEDQLDYGIMIDSYNEIVLGCFSDKYQAIGYNITLKMEDDKIQIEFESIEPSG